MTLRVRVTPHPSMDDLALVSVFGTIDTNEEFEVAANALDLYYSSDVRQGSCEDIRCEEGTRHPVTYVHLPSELGASSRTDGRVFWGTTELHVHSFVNWYVNVPKTATSS